MYDLVCTPKVQISFFGTLLLAGFFFGSIFLVRLGDIIGRKKVVVVSTLVSSVCLVGILLSPSLITLFVCIFIFGLTCGPRGLSFVYALELTTSEYEVVYSTVALAIDATCMLILGLYFYFFKSMIPLLVFLTVVQTLAISLVALNAPESPKFLHDKGDTEGFIRALLRIAHVNKKDLNLNELHNFTLNTTRSNFDTINEEEAETTLSQDNDHELEEQQKLGMRYMIKNRPMLLNTVALTVAWAVSSYSFYFIEFYMKYVPVDSIYLLAMLIGVSDVAASIAFRGLIQYVSSKKIILFSYLGLALVSLVFALMMWVMSPLSAKEKLILTVFIFVMRLFSSTSFIGVYYANNEYFPALFKGGIFAVTNIGARLSAALSPLIAEGMNNPAITIAIAGSIAFGTTSMLQKQIEGQKK